MISAPLLEKILNYSKKDKARFHVPGHRQGEGLPPEFRKLAPEFFKMDLTEVPGLDDLHNPGGVIARAQALAARLFGAGQTFFLVNGTTCGLQALIMTVAREGEYILVPRNVHRSVLAGLILSGTIPVYLQPEIIPLFEFASGITLDEVRKKLQACPMCRAVLAVHPTYFGTVGELSGLVREVHSLNKPVIVDEAHGTHLYFSREMPEGALKCGADGVVQSVHKTGGSLTQSSWLHIQGNRVSAQRVRDSLRLVQTTSPSYLLMASLDAARRQLAARGEKIMERVLELAREARKAISQIKGLSLLGEEHVRGEGIAGIDPTRLVISVKEMGWTGFEAKKILSKRYQIEVEMADFNNIIAVVSLGTTKEDIRRLIDTLKEFSVRERRDVKRRPSGMVPPSIPPLKLSPRQAWMARSRPVRLDEASGLVSGEMICVYPPGIPVVCPGEEITGEIKDYLLAVRNLKLHCQGPEDPELNTIRVLDD